MSILHFDEIAFMSYNWIVVPTATNAMIKASEQTRAAGLPSPVIYTTTAGNPDTKEGSYALGIFDSAAPFSESMYDLRDRDELLEVIGRSSDKKMLFLEFSYRQLGKTDEWFKDVSARSNSSQDDINRDLLNMWQSATDNCVIPPELLTKMRRSQRDPSHTDLSDGFIVRWYVDRTVKESDEFQNRSMVMGMDTSENVGRDFTTFVILDPRDMSVLATCRCNEANTIQVARHCVRLLCRYRKMVFIPERNNTGTAIIDFVIEQLQKMEINPYFRIYNEVIQNLEDPKFKDINIYAFREIYGKVRSYFGYRTSGGTGGTSRNTLYKTVMMKALELNYNKLYDRSLISEFCNLTERNGRIDHPEGLHDDTCFVAGTLIRTPIGQVPIEELCVGDLVLTREGYKPILYIHENTKYVITRFGLTGTPDHPFITPLGIVPFEKLTLWSPIYVWNEKQSCIMEKRIIDTLSLPAVLCEIISIVMTNGKRLLSHFIDKCGWTTMVQFLKECISTTRMETLATIPLRTSNVFPQKPIQENTLRLRNVELCTQNYPKSEILLGSGEPKILRKLWSFINRTGRNRKVLKTGEKIIQNWFTKLLSVVVRNLQQFVTRHQVLKLFTDGVGSILRKLKNCTARMLRSQENVRERKEKVYNLHVSECHEYYVNNILVHNCVSYLIAAYLLFFGRNLRHYGITNDIVLADVVVENAPTRAAQHEQIALRTRIKELEELLARNPAHIVRQSYLRELAVLKPMVDDEILQAEPLAVSQMQHHDEELEYRPKGATVETLRTFEKRWNRL